ncbi:uncharacterized protein LOC111041247 [Myzus persicae]|uniref:uncharacterized protein LOC111041247 n=1 Tax=Myzus persicae TaxID=13164 RepID=UPI000B93602B|nr:uncharacterized protein LOC111041247 [Myzus persicae]
MKSFVVVISVALAIMFVFATDTAAAPADYEDPNDMFLLTGPVDGMIPQVRVTGSNGHYNKISTKHPLYVIVKTVVKLLMKIFSPDNSI